MTPTPAPTPLFGHVDGVARLGGFTVLTFGHKERASFVRALSARLYVQEERIEITSVRTARSRRLNSPRRLSSAESVVEFRISVLGGRSAQAVTFNLMHVYDRPAQFISTLTQELSTVGAGIPAELSIVEEAPSIYHAPVTAAPTPIPATLSPTPAPTEPPSKAAVEVTLEVYGVSLALFKDVLPRFTNRLASMYDVDPSVVLIGNIVSESKLVNASSTDLAWQLGRRLSARRTQFIRVTYYVRVQTQIEARKTRQRTTMPRLLVVLAESTAKWALDVRIVGLPHAVELTHVWSPTPAPTPSPTPPPTPVGVLPSPQVKFSSKVAPPLAIGLVGGVGALVVLVGVYFLHHKFRSGVETAKAFSDLHGPKRDVPPTVVARPTHVIQTIDGGLIAIDPTTAVAISPHAGQRAQVLPLATVGIPTAQATASIPLAALTKENLPSVAV